MTNASASFHEPKELLLPETMESHRGIASLLEELEAVDWYDQRVDAAQDPQLKAILAHNRDEEKEHAMMLLEWLRRRDPMLDKQMRTYLFTEGDIAVTEEDATQATMPAGQTADGQQGSLGIASLRGKG